MINKKAYYSISEVAKMLDIQEHTLRFWDSKIQNLSNRSSKGKTRFFNLKQIEKISKINEILKNNDSIGLANEMASNKKFLNHFNDSNKTSNYSYKYLDKFNRIRGISNKLKNLIIEK